jgi:hypothetical protein
VPKILINSRNIDETDPIPSSRTHLSAEDENCYPQNNDEEEKAFQSQFARVQIIRSEDRVAALNYIKQDLQKSSLTRTS